MNNNSNINNGFGQLSDSTSLFSSKALSSSSKVNSSSNNSTSREVIQLQTQATTVAKFIWKDKGQLVYLTGSFCNWKEKFLMQKTPEGYSISLNLLEGTHQYKFIVDGEWKYSHYHPTINEHSYINNILEVKLPHQAKETPLERKTSGYNTETEFVIERQPAYCHQEYQGLFCLNGDNRILKTWMNDAYARLPSFCHIYTNHLLIGDRHFADGSFIDHYSIIKKIKKKYVTVTYYTKANEKG